MTFVNMLRYVAERWQTQFQNFHRIICRLWMSDLKYACEDDVVFSWFVVEQIYEDHSDPARQRFYHNTLLSPPLKACPHVYKAKFLPGQIALQRRDVMTHTDCAVAGMEECWSQGCQLFNQMPSLLLSEISSVEEVLWWHTEHRAPLTAWHLTLF